MSEKKSPSLKKNFILSTLYEILCVITPFVTAPYISRVLGASQIGVFSYTSSIQMYFVMFGALGTATYGAREIARNRDNAEDRTKLFWEIELLSIITSSIALIGWGIFVFFSKQYRIYYIVLTLGILNTMFDISWYFRGIEQFKYTVSKNSVVKILCVACLFIFVKDKDDLFIYFIINMGFNFLGTLSMWLSLPKFLVKLSDKKLKILPHFKETLVYFIPTIATSIYTILDRTLIGAITKDESQNGYYEQAHKIINIVKTLTSTSLNSVMGVRISYLFKENRIDEIKEKIEMSINYILFIGLGCTFGLIGVAGNFVPLFFGEGYDSVILLLQLLSPMVVIIGVSNALGAMYYNPAGLRKFSANLLIIGAVVNLIFNLIFIPRLQSYGAAIGSLIAESLITILYISFSKEYYNFKLLIKCSWKKLLSGSTMLLFLFFLERIIKNSIICIFVQVFSGIVIYFILLTILHDSFMFSFVIPKVKAKFCKNKSVVNDN